VWPKAAHLVRRARRTLTRREFPVVPAHLGRIDYDGAEIVIGVTSRAEIMSRLTPCAKEPWTVRWLEQGIRDGDVFYDVGANVGTYSLIAAAQGRDGLSVLAFEPGYASFAALCDNVVRNRREEVIVPLPVLLADRTGLVTLGYSDVAAGGAEHSLEPGANAVYRQSVLAYRLDDLVAQFRLPPPSLLKVDVDGAEAAVLTGAMATLEQERLRSVLVEVERASEADVVGLLEGAGFAARERIDERDGVRLHNVWYGIFERDGGGRRRVGS
jgi:FkbM family methyltransferase